jgi:hypothetical protein
MKPLSLIVFLIGVSFAQRPAGPAVGTDHTSDHAPPDNDRLPNGKSQRDEIAKADYKKNLDDAAELVRLATELKADFEKESAYVVSLKDIKKTEDIEKLERNIRGRLKRY